MQRSLRANVLAVLLTLPAAFGLVWLGCATADEEVEATPQRKPRDSAVLLDEDGNPIEGDGMIFPSDDSSKPLCTTKTATPNACTSPTDLGTFKVSDTKSISDGIAEAAGDLWYKVTFGDLTNLAAHPSIKLTSTDPNIVMEVNKSCAGESVSCMDEAGVARNIKNYEVKYDWDAEIVEASTEGDGGTFKAIEVGEGGAVYIHVFRVAGAAKSGCDFKLDISN